MYSSWKYITRSLLCCVKRKVRQTPRARARERWNRSLKEWFILKPIDWLHYIYLTDTSRLLHAYTAIVDRTYMYNIYVRVCVCVRTFVKLTKEGCKSFRFIGNIFKAKNIQNVVKTIHNHNGNGDNDDQKIATTTNERIESNCIILRPIGNWNEFSMMAGHPKSTRKNALKYDYCIEL